MKAAVLTALNAPLTLADVELTQLQFGQVLVRVLMSGICGAQLQEIRGEKGNAKFLPHLLGHEGCGIVQEIGPGVTKVKAGDTVCMHWRKGDGIESPFPEYVYAKQKIQSGKVTTFSEKSICSENRLTRVPAGISPQVVALLGCGLSTALGTIELEAKLKMGESIMIIGCGGLGLNLLHVARMRRAFPIVVVDNVHEKAGTAVDHGATHFVTNPNDITGRFDVIIDTAGNPQAMAEAITHLAPSGRYIMIGQPRPGSSVELYGAAHLFEGEGKTIKATQGGGFLPHLDIPRYINLHKAGLLDISGVVSDIVPLSEINRGISLVRGGNAGRVMIDTTA